MAANKLLERLPADELAQLRPFLDRQFINVGDVFTERGRPVRNVYFPETCVVSVVVRMDDGTFAEVGVKGSEALVGLSAVKGMSTSSTTTVALVEGHVQRLAVDRFLEALDGGSSLRKTLPQFCDAFLFMVTQIAACNSLHSVRSRLARWLLMTQDRAGEADLRFTHQFLADTLGVRRAAVTIALRELVQSGSLHISRRKVTIVERAALEGLSCSCYATLRDRFLNLFDGG